MKLLITQSNYIPWKGYFDAIASADHFIIYDDMQFTKRDWRNRNQIRTPNGTQWLTIPVEVKGKFHQKIKDTKISDPTWAINHWETIRHIYSRAPFFSELKDFFESLYLTDQSEWLSEVNYKFLASIMQLIGIRTPMSWSSEYVMSDDRNQRLVDLCVQKKATMYLTGPSAKSYMDETVFARNAIHVRYFDFSKYEPYPQMYEPFVHTVSILDLLFCVGPKAHSLIFKNDMKE